jgi:hypothetical protein
LRKNQQEYLHTATAGSRWNPPIKFSKRDVESNPLQEGADLGEEL